MDLHVTVADTEPSQFSAGGAWSVHCRQCTWAVHGTYSGMPGWGATELDALHMAHSLGPDHESSFNPARTRKGAAS